jgi:hypothetical protein
MQFAHLLFVHYVEVSFLYLLEFTAYIVYHHNMLGMIISAKSAKSIDWLVVVIKNSCVYYAVVI